MIGKGEEGEERGWGRGWSLDFFFFQASPSTSTYACVFNVKIYYSPIFKLGSPANGQMSDTAILIITSFFF